MTFLRLAQGEGLQTSVAGCSCCVSGRWIRKNMKNWERGPREYVQGIQVGSIKKIIFKTSFWNPSVFAMGSEEHFLCDDKLSGRPPSVAERAAGPQNSFPSAHPRSHQHVSSRCPKRKASSVLEFTPDPFKPHVSFALRFSHFVL